MMHFGAAPGRAAHVAPVEPHFSNILRSADSIS